MTNSPDAVLEQLLWRYAVKKFDSTRKIAPDLWAKLEDAALLSPSSYGLQPWKIVVVTDPAVRAQLRPAAWNQAQIVDASHLVVFCVKKGMGAADAQRLIERTAAVRGVPVESLLGYRDMIAGSFGRNTPEANDAWMSRQVYIALGVFLSAAAMMGVDACPMEGFQPDKYDEILKLKERGYGSLVLAAAGYRAADDGYASAPKVRYPKAEVIEWV